MKMLMIILFIILFVVVAIIFCSKKERFTQGYNYVISECIRKCELDHLRKDPFYVPLQEGGYMTQSYCEQVCAAEYNKNENTGGFPNCGACMVRRPPYSKCPLQMCRYFGCPNKRFDVIGNDVKTV